MEFETARCVVRPFTANQIDAFMDYRNNEEWMRFQGFKGLTKEEYEKALIGENDISAGVQLAVVSKESGALLGDLYLKREDDACWIGYTAAPQHARQGYLSEAVLGALQALKQHGVTRVKAGVLPGNIASIEFLYKLNFQYAGVEDGELIYDLSLTGG